MPSPRQSNSHDRDIGALQATVSLLAESMKEQAATHERMMRQHHEQYTEAIKNLQAEITTMRSLVDQAKGGWKILIGVGTISATLAAIATKLLSVISFTPR